jgi:hypothetical protein
LHLEGRAAGSSHGSAGNRRATVRLLWLPPKLEGARAWSKIKNVIFGSEIDWEFRGEISQFDTEAEPALENQKKLSV